MSLPFPVYIQYGELTMVEGSYGHSPGPGGRWNPPRKCEHFQTSFKTPWLAWSPGSLSEVDSRLEKHIKAFDHTSLCRVPGGQDPPHYVHFPYDATRTSVKEKAKKGEDWEPLTFHCVSDEPECQIPGIWSVGYHGPQNYINAKRNDAWEDQFLPHIYFALDDEDPKEIRGLVGRLSLLLALSAFCAPPGMDHFKRTVRENFRPTGTLWLDTAYGQGRTKIKRRCVVISVGLGPNSANEEDVRNWNLQYQKDKLGEWEDGVNGAILTVKEKKEHITYVGASQRPTSSAHSQLSQYPVNQAAIFPKTYRLPQAHVAPPYTAQGQSIGRTLSQSQVTRDVSDMQSFEYQSRQQQPPGSTPRTHERPPLPTRNQPDETQASARRQSNQKEKERVGKDNFDNKKKR